MLFLWFLELQLTARANFWLLATGSVWDWLGAMGLCGCWSRHTSRQNRLSLSEGILALFPFPHEGTLTSSGLGTTRIWMLVKITTDGNLS